MTNAGPQRRFQQSKKFLKRPKNPRTGEQIIAATLPKAKARKAISEPRDKELTLLTVKNRCD